jgi:hypothetical protein
MKNHYMAWLKTDITSYEYLERMRKQLEGQTDAVLKQEGESWWASNFQDCYVEAAGHSMQCFINPWYVDLPERTMEAKAFELRLAKGIAHPESLSLSSGHAPDLVDLIDKVHRTGKVPEEFSEIADHVEYVADRAETVLRESYGGFRNPKK